MARTHQGAPFVTSSYSERQCVAVARASTVGVLDSKEPTGPVLTTSQAAWTAFVGKVKDDLD